MASNEIRVGDYGTILYGIINDIDGVVDISGASAKTITLLKPNGNTIQANADFYTDGTDGKLKYTTVSGDIDVCGSWQVQWKITLSSGEWSTDIVTFKVHGNLV